MRIVRVTAFALLLARPDGVSGQSDPLAGFDRYPGFRNLTGMAGSMYGVDSQGWRSLSGPTALSTPVAHVLGRGQFQLGAGRMSFDSTPRPFDSGRTNGTVFLTAGATIGRVNAAATAMLLSEELDQAFHYQFQYVPDENANLVFSVGVMDLRGHGGAAGSHIPGDGRSARSFFGVATHRIDGLPNPLYVSAGLGTRRYGNGFGSLSYQVAQPVRLWFEHDGFGFNYGALLSARTSSRHRAPELNALIGIVAGRYLMVGAGIGL